jgi:hypothetical protein
MSDDTVDGAISIRTFCLRNDLGTTKAYAEINAGRLVARKCGAKTLITLADEKAWRDSLPRLKPAPKGQLEVQTIPHG